MSFYRPEINRRFECPQSSGRVLAASAVGTNATFVCGCLLRFTLQIDSNTKDIVDSKFQTNGCGYLTAAADILAAKIIGNRLIDLHGLNNAWLRAEVERELGQFEPGRVHCLELALETLHAAFNDFRSAQLEEWSGEKALICTCFGVSEETIERLVAERHLDSVEAVTDACNAGGGCGSCQFLIRDIIDSAETNF